jgi:hypothetical protein
MMKIVYKIVAFVIIFVLMSCNQGAGENLLSTEGNVEVNQDTSYAQYIKRNKIKSLTVTGFQFAFGEPAQPGFKLYEVIYNEDGLPLDSLIFNNNVLIGKVKNIYSKQGKLLTSTIHDNEGNELETISRDFDEKGNEVSFVMLKKGQLYYKQEITYNANNLLTKIIEFDEKNEQRIITEYAYNDQQKKISKTESNAKGVILQKEAWVYDEKGNNTQYIIYDISGKIVEKNYLKNYTNEGQPKLLEKYDKNDSLLVTHQYEYDSKGRETKSTLYNGINQIISQTNATYDAKGNQLTFEMYEGGAGFKGRDELQYNDVNQEVELKVVGPDGKQLKRRLTTYTGSNLKFEVINYDKLDDPNFKLQYTYTFYP